MLKFLFVVIALWSINLIEVYPEEAKQGNEVYSLNLIRFVKEYRAKIPLPGFPACIAPSFLSPFVILFLDSCYACPYIFLRSHIG